MIKKVHSKSVRKKTYRKCRTKNDSLFQEIKKIRFGGRYFMDWIVLKKCVRIVFAT
ncbi:hypothetical protein LEP1GSC121_1180 [Leptospira borgpetersenii serovar Castellonis str. 200801910]|nr:hypothetical protein LEP1GSC121_1180 [Leptospira borgpetersenii serovar Castellonis str. 200801910]